MTIMFQNETMYLYYWQFNRDIVHLMLYYNVSDKTFTLIREQIIRSAACFDIS